MCGWLSKTKLYPLIVQVERNVFLISVSSVGVIWRLFDHSALELLLFPVDLEGGHIIVWSKLVFPNKVEVHLL